MVINWRIFVAGGGRMLYLTRQIITDGVSKNTQFGPYTNWEEANSLLAYMLAARDMVADEPIFVPRKEGDP